jgi:alpha-D-xyloside xylohydrolase
MRPMALAFPDDPAVTYLDRQYMLGDDLLVAPVMSASGDVEYYVPAGRWTRFGTTEVIEGPRWVRENHAFDSVPLLVRPGAVLPIGHRTDRPDYDYRDGITLRLHVPSPSLEPKVINVGDTTFTVKSDRIERKGAALPWRVEIVGGASADLAADEDVWVTKIGE